MRKIEQRMINAIKARESFLLRGTQVISEPHFADVILHGNHIARVYTTTHGFSMTFSMQGYVTRLTKSRLNALFTLIGKAGIHARLYTANGRTWIGINYPDDCVSLLIIPRFCYHTFIVPHVPNPRIQVDKVPMYSLSDENFGRVA